MRGGREESRPCGVKGGHGMPRPCEIVRGHRGPPLQNDHTDWPGPPYFARVALHFSVLPFDATVPSMELPLTRPWYWAPPAAKLI